MGIILNNAITALPLLSNVRLASKLGHSKAILQILVSIFAVSFVYEKKSKKVQATLQAIILLTVTSVYIQLLHNYLIVLPVSASIVQVQ